MTDVPDRCFCGQHELTKPGGIWRDPEVHRRDLCGLGSSIKPEMETVWSPVFANGFGCDLCPSNDVVGWTRIRLPNRSRGGVREVVVYMVCAEHMVGEAVHPTNKQIFPLQEDS